MLEIRYNSNNMYFIKRKAAFKDQRSLIIHWKSFLIEKYIVERKRKKDVKRKKEEYEKREKYILRKHTETKECDPDS